MTESVASGSSQYPLTVGSIADSVRKAIAQGDRQAALRLLRALVLIGAEAAVDLTPATADALVATAQAEPEERDCF